ncbi:oligoribonuclease [bacterium]|nr:oligoribonuclease [bacterium]
MPKAAQYDAQNLIWIDLEMTGLDPDSDVIIEIATLVTDKYLHELAVGPVLAVSQPHSYLEGMDEWCTTHHTRSGLVQRVIDSTVDAAEAERQTLEFLRGWVPEGVSPMAGNSICQDRRFLVRGMPELAKYFHYRNLDVSTLKELAARWAPDIAAGYRKESEHLALADIRDSVDELRYYRQHFIRMDGPAPREDSEDG